MNSEVIQKLIISIVLLFLIVAFFQVFKLYARKTQRKLRIQDRRYFDLKRIMILFSAALFIASLILIWGIDLKNLWVSVAGMLAMIAVAFFAVWSLIGNILAGLILFFTSPFKINDTIEIKPEGVKGKVLAINTFYTLLVDENDDHINIPNSLFFQKYIVKLRPKESK